MRKIKKITKKNRSKWFLKLQKLIKLSIMTDIGKNPKNYNEKDWKAIAEQIKKEMRPLEKQDRVKEWSGEVICTFSDIAKKNSKK